MKPSVSALILALGIVAAPAAIAADREPLERLRTLAAAAVAAVSAPTVQVTAGGLDPRLRLPACAQEPTALPPANPGGASVTVAVSCAEPVQWTVHVPVQRRDLRTVLVLARAVRAGETVDAGMFRTLQRDVAQLPFGFVDDAQHVAGRQFRRAMSAGAVPAPGDFVAPKWVQRGQTVELLGRAGAIEVRAEGRALGDGADGERVRVENRGSRRVVEGIVRAPGVVEVSL